MANGRISLSVEGEAKLIKLMSELNWNEKRPEALKLAFAKGLTFSDEIPEERKDKKTGFVIGDGVIARGDEYILFKHILIDKIGEPLDAKAIDNYIERYIEKGLEVISEEIKSLSNLDNYLLFLVDKHI